MPPQDPLHPEKLYQKLKGLKNAGGQALLNLDQGVEVQVSLRPDKSIGRGKFKADPLIPGGYLAHPVTIRAVRKEIFSVGQEGFIDLECLTQCNGCQSTIDAQFWNFCPYCEASLAISSKK